jgi:hypothetical protein
MLVAGAGLIAAGAFATALNQETASYTAPTVLSSKMSIGETTTSEVPSTIPTPVAQPSMKADIPCGFTSGC